jgi:hypothetical protein
VSTHIASFGQLAALKAKLLRLPETAAKIAPKVAERLSELATEAFDSGRTVYGDPRPAGIDGTSLDLKESGALRAQALRYVAEGRRVRASLSLRYARYYVRYGILPRKGSLPPAWDKEIGDLCQRELDKELGQ